jgi:hypothetical protein
VAFDEFCALEPKHALSFVIPAKAGIQIRGVLVDCAFFLGFPLVFPFARLWIPAFAGMTKGDESRETWAEERKKGATQNRDRKYGLISELPEVCKRLYSIELTKIRSPLFTHKFF